MGSTTRALNGEHDSPPNQLEELLARIAASVETALKLLQAIDEKLSAGDSGHDADSRNWLSVKQAVNFSGVSYTSILRAINRGRLKASCLNPDALRPTYRIKPKDLEAWLEANGGASGAPPKMPKVRRKIRSRYFGEI